MTVPKGGDHGAASARLARRLERLCTDAASLSLDRENPVVHRLAAIVADTVGVMNAGGRSPELRRLVASDPLDTFAKPAGAARVLVAPYPQTDAASAAWINGAAAAFLELDEGVRPTGHPAAHVVPAALATAQWVAADGLETLTAVAAGYEVAARLFETVALPWDRHPHGHLGALGASVAVARLRGCDPVAAVRIAATQPLLTGWDACYVGATARNFWTGHANRVGVEATTLVAAGLTGATESLSSLLIDHLTSPAVLDEPVDPATLRVHGNYFKFHSACALNHAALDAVMAIVERSGPIDSSQVERVDVTTIDRNLRIDRPARPNSLSTRFSLPYAVAAALTHGHTGPGAFEFDERTANVASRVHVSADDARDGWPDEAHATVTIRWTGNGSATETVANPVGHHTNPPQAGQLRRKFVDLVAVDRAARADASELHNELLGLATCPDVSTLRLHPTATEPEPTKRSQP